MIDSYLELIVMPQKNLELKDPQTKNLRRLSSNLEAPVRAIKHLR